MSVDIEPTYHSEELDRARAEGRPVLVSRLFRYDHQNHEYPLGTLVEVDVEIFSHTEETQVELKGLCRLYVVGHMRDCDGTPLYVLSSLPVRYPEGSPYSTEANIYHRFAVIVRNGYSAESLTPVGKAKEFYDSLSEMFDE